MGSLTVDDVVRDADLTKLLFELSSGDVAEQAQVVCLVGTESVLVAGADDDARLLAEASRLVDVCFSGRGPLVVHCPGDRKVQVAALKHALRLRDAGAVRTHLGAIRRSVADNVARAILPKFQTHLQTSMAGSRAPPATTSSSTTALRFDDVVACPELIAYLALFVHSRRPDRHDQDLLWRWWRATRKGGDEADALRDAIWAPFLRSAQYAELVEHVARRRSTTTGAPRRSTLAVLRAHPATSSMVLTTTTTAEAPAPGRASELAFVGHCRWQPNRKADVAVVERHPDVDADVALPVPTTIARFCFPTLSPDPDSFVRPRTFSFVLTGADGRRLNGACMQVVGDADAMAVDAIVVLTERDEQNALRRRLERVRPAPGAPLAASMQALTPLVGRRSNQESSMSAPDCDVDVLFRVLHPLRIVDALELVLLEQKVLLVSSQLTVLSNVAQTLRALIQPFQLRSVFVPVLPNALIETLQCPTPFLVGMHRSMMGLGVDLGAIDTLTMFDLDSDHEWRLGSAAGSAAAPTLPPSIRASLLASLQRVCIGACVHSDFQDDDDGGGGPHTVASWMDALRRELVGNLLFEAGAFVTRVPLVAPGPSPTCTVLFDAPAFLQTKPGDWRPFLQALFATACFADYIAGPDS